MSGHLQTGHHPDADQLNAFIEHALPAHEHEETLAHLAICMDCRAVVALALPPVAETLPPAAPARQPWFKGWRLLWPIATAATLAALVVATIHLRNVSIAPTGPVVPQVAEKLAPPPIPAEPSQPQPVESKQRKSIAPTATDRATKPAPAPVATTKPAQDNNLALLPLQGRATTSLSLPSERPAATAGIVSANGAGVALDQAANAPPSAASPPATASNDAAKMALSVGVNAAAGGAISRPAPAPQTAHGVAAPDLAQSILRTHPLPGGVPALSIVYSARQNQTLAIDIHGALFLSGDFGQHWTSVTPPWPDRAMKVDLAYAGSSHGAGFAGVSAMKSGAQFMPQNGHVGAPARISSGAVLSSLGGTVTDTSGANIPGATVIVSATPTQLARMVKTGANGNYLIEGLVPGTYSVEASYPGFEKQQLAGVAVVPGRTATANLTLKVGAATQTVEVSSAEIQMPLDTPRTKKKKTAPAPTPAAQPIFEITTDVGEHWVSTDGLVWNLK